MAPKTTVRQPPVNILHLADLHFGAGAENAIPFRELAEPLAELIKTLSPAPIVVLSGDITFKGRREGYEEASDFFERLRRNTGLDRNRIVACPGNHDIVVSGAGGIPEGFGEFDRFIYSIRHDDKCHFSGQSCLSIEIDGITFLLANSAFHFEKEFGLADIRGITKILNSIPSPLESESRVAVIHHNPIPIIERDNSTIRNAYYLLELLDKKKFGVLLHGHQHTTAGFPIGETPVTCFGVSSFNFSTERRLNGLNVHQISANRITSVRHTLVLDGKAGDSTGYGVIIPPLSSKGT